MSKNESKLTALQQELAELKQELASAKKRVDAIPQRYDDIAPNKLYLMEQLAAVRKLLAQLDRTLDTTLAPQDSPATLYRPQVGQLYYSVDSAGDWRSTPWYGDSHDEARYACGNVLRTREDAEHEAERRRVLHALRRYVAEHQGGDGTFVPERFNYYIYYDRRRDCLTVDWVTYYDTGTVYSSSDAVLRDAITSIGAERLKRYVYSSHATQPSCAASTPCNTTASKDEE